MAVIVRNVFLLAVLASCLRGEKLEFATYFGGTGTPRDVLAAALPDGSLVLAGIAPGVDFPVTSDSLRPASRFEQLFVARIDGAQVGSEALRYSGFFASGVESINALEIGPQGYVYLLGSIRGADLITTPDSLQPEPNTTSLQEQTFFLLLDLDGVGPSVLIY